MLKLIERPEIISTYAHLVRCRLIEAINDRVEFSTGANEGFFRRGHLRLSHVAMVRSKSLTIKTFVFIFMIKMLNSKAKGMNP